MIRRILLLMMTALLSVGAWAATENVWTGEVTPGWYQGDGDAGECNHFGVVGFTAERKLMKGDYIVVTATTSNQYYNQIKVCKVKEGDGYWAGDVLTTISNYDFSSNDSKLFIPVSEAIVSALNSETAPQYTLYFDGYNYTMTSVDVVFNRGKANLYYNESGKSLSYYGGQLLAPHLFTAASVGDIVTIDVTSAIEWGNVSIYNKCPKSVWDGTDMVDPEGLEKLTTLNVDPANAPTTVRLVLTEELLANAIVNGLSLGDGKYTFTSVDLVYALMLANDADNTDAINYYGQSFSTDVTLADRTLTKDGNWNTLCLPFALTSSQIAASPLAGATIMELNAETSSLADGTLTLNFTTATEIVAGNPYIVKWTDTSGSVENPLFEGVTIKATTPTDVVFNGGNCKFVGQFSPFTIDAGNKDEIIMLGSGSMLGYSQNARTLNTFRAHFEVPTTSGGSAARAFMMNFGGVETTGIISVQGSGSMVNGSDAWYSLGGQTLQSAPTAKGVYIQNGRKVVVK